MTANSKRPVILKAYGTVRGGAAKHVQAALPRVGDLVMKHAAPTARSSQAEAD
jgi:hypothetical protein